MKKKIIYLTFLALTIVTASMILYSCQKSVTKPSIQQSESAFLNSAGNTSNRAAMDHTASVTSNCSCPAPSVTCSTSCVFSDCCVCCTGGNACGAGCYFGIAKCECSEKEKGQAAISGKIRFKIENFEKFKNYLQTDLKVWTDKLDIDYRALLSKPHASVKNYTYSYNNSGTALEYDLAQFSSFKDSYKEFIDNLSIDQQESILKFISLL